MRGRLTAVGLPSDIVVQRSSRSRHPADRFRRPDQPDTPQPVSASTPRAEAAIATPKGTSRVWFGLTESKDKADWVKFGAVRAWFTLNLEAADRPFYLAQLALLMEAMREGQHVEVGHGGAITTLEKWDPNDSFQVDGIRLLRAPMRISG